MLIEKLKTSQWDDKRDLIIPGNHDMTIAFCVEHFLTLAKAAIENHGAFYVALSGGSTPKAIFERLSISSYDMIDWKKVYLFWSDERSVPPDSPESNYHMAMEAGLKKLPIKHIYRMVAEENIEESAKAYEKTIHDTLKGKPFDLIMLGLGEDGHTASLFPNTEGLKAVDREIIANFVPQKATWRMTMTFTCINRATHTVFYVLGAGKKQMLAEVLKKNAPLIYPAQHVGTKINRALWIADEAAGALLK